MPVYEYKCKCGCYYEIRCDFDVYDNHRDQFARCPDCGGTAGRAYDIQVQPPMQAHYNPTVGKEIIGNKHFKEELKKASERQTLETGIPHSYVPMHPGDVKASIREEAAELNEIKKRKLGISPKSTVHTMTA